jgi:hypothetical protein
MNARGKPDLPAGDECAPRVGASLTLARRVEAPFGVVAGPLRRSESHAQIVRERTQQTKISKNTSQNT